MKGHQLLGGEILYNLTARRLRRTKRLTYLACLPLILLFQNCSGDQNQFETTSQGLLSASTLSTSTSTSPSSTNLYNGTGFGTYLKPYAANSPWNSRPAVFTLDTYQIPTDIYQPMIASGSLSTSIFYATSSDAAMTFHGVYDSDAVATRDVVLPHFPSDAASATGGDGHMDVLDSTTGIIHSFWQARNNNGTWTASLYAWTRVDGAGWGDPAHYYQGARAAAVPPSAGIIRAGEINDGTEMYNHALAMSLCFSGLSNKGYVYPATSADATYSQNYGGVPEGALLLLPSTFDLTNISNPAVRKVAKTLMTYGAYVVDRNDGTPFAIYQEIGTTTIATWQQSADTQQIRAALRQVHATQFYDGNGNLYTPNLKQNILSMRGSYSLVSGSAGKVLSTFDEYNDKRVWGPTTATTTENAYTNVNLVTWSKPVAGDSYTLTAITEGGATMSLVIGTFDSGIMKNGDTKTFAWPASGTSSIYVRLLSGIGASSSARATLIKN